MAGGTPRARRGPRSARRTRPGGAARGLRAGLALLTVLGLVGLGLLPTSLAAFSATTSNSASSFTARTTFGLIQTAPCFSHDGSGGCTSATGIAAGRSAVVSPDGRHVYVATTYSPDSARSGVAEFSRNATTGALTQLAGPDRCVSNGALSGCTAIPGALSGVQDVAISPDGRHVYAAASTGSTVAALSRNASTGVLTALAGPNTCVYHSAATAVTGCTSARVLDGASGVAVSPDGEFVYVASSRSDSVTVFARDDATGALTQLAGTAGCITNSAVGGCVTGRGLNQPGYLRLSPDGSSVYVASSTSRAVAVFQRNPTTGVLTQAGTPNACVYDSGASAITGCTAVRGLSGVKNVAIAPDGRTVYTMAVSGDAVAAFTRNTGTGVLTQLAAPDACVYRSGATAITGCTAVTGLDGPTAMTFSADGLFAFVSMSTYNAVLAFRLNTTTGALAQLAGTAGCLRLSGTGSCAAGLGLSLANYVTTSPDGRDVYAVGGNANSTGFVVPLNLAH
ncbi:beta-propeller fold lactonase family protein [Actinoplanes sp. NPDC049118]|uniref:lactonase family protein n=1 Tax=Actinoplanes sp. NPDC049118 TaxID=3155769 RepID=UPI0033DFB3C0